MTDSVQWQILESIKNTLQGMSFSPQGRDACGVIRPENIVIRKVGMSARSDEKVSLPQIATPGIVITPPRRIPLPNDVGEVQMDWVLYPVGIEIVDNDATDRDANLRTYMKWEQQIVRAFNCHSYTDIDVSSSCAYSFAEVASTLDEKLWLRSPGKVVASIVVTVHSRETRGIET